MYAANQVVRNLQTTIGMNREKTIGVVRIELEFQ
jgi:hypothetical protein